MERLQTKSTAAPAGEPGGLRVCIHRGTKQIGGTCIELEAEGQRLLLDLGLPLDGDPDDPTLVPSTRSIEEEGLLEAIVLTHAHMDHRGLLHRAHPKIPVAMGAPSKLGLRGRNTAGKLLSYCRARKSLSVQVSGIIAPSSASSGAGCRPKHPRSRPASSSDLPLSGIPPNLRPAYAPNEDVELQENVEVPIEMFDRRSPRLSEVSIGIEYRPPIGVQF